MIVYYNPLRYNFYLYLHPFVERKMPKFIKIALFLPVDEKKCPKNLPVQKMAVILHRF